MPILRLLLVGEMRQIVLRENGSIRYKVTIHLHASNACTIFDLCYANPNHEYLMNSPVVKSVIESSIAIRLQRSGALASVIKSVVESSTAIHCHPSPPFIRFA